MHLSELHCHTTSVCMYVDHGPSICSNSSFARRQHLGLAMADHLIQVVSLARHLNTKLSWGPFQGFVGHPRPSRGSFLLS